MELGQRDFAGAHSSVRTSQTQALELRTQTRRRIVATVSRSIQKTSGLHLALEQEGWEVADQQKASRTPVLKL